MDNDEINNKFFSSHFLFQKASLCKKNVKKRAGTLKKSRPLHSSRFTHKQLPTTRGSEPEPGPEIKPHGQEDF